MKVGQYSTTRWVFAPDRGLGHCVFFPLFCPKHMYSTALSIHPHNSNQCSASSLIRFAYSFLVPYAAPIVRVPRSVLLFWGEHSKKNVFTFFTGSVQRKLRWDENGVIQRVWASHRGAEYYFVDLGGLHLVFAFFPLPVSTSRIIGEFWKNR